MQMKGELFSQQFIPMLLDGTKIRTSRPIPHSFDAVYKAACFHGKWSETYGDQISDSILEWYVTNIAKPKYKPGDIIYVRETWNKVCNLKCHNHPGKADCSKCDVEEIFIYKADGAFENDAICGGWKPSIHMPREAARIFLKVIDVKIQQLGDLKEQDAIDDGFISDHGLPADGGFRSFWLGKYGFNFPWLRVYYFKLCEKPVE